ncbi:hypothetical protein HPB51_014388 [Rhipicephalus microplus]|uniref:Brinker DNA-binding domain-containing protein n=1 Tax=Rhipicephalus microplus TaxID=6941 RepID=A0A9J6F559_RHIMP|nr:hypothetical protein HPB51_014388 [Rhipicephalus microplus]
MSAVGSQNTRRSFTAAFKRAAILHAEETNNCAAGRKFRIGECVVRKWRLQREEIFSCDSKRRGFRGPKSGRFSELKVKLAAYVTDLRDRSLLVTCEMVTQQARVYAVQAGIPRSRFKAKFQCHTRAASRLLGASQGPRWLEDVLALPVLASLPSGRRKSSCCHQLLVPENGPLAMSVLHQGAPSHTYCPCAVSESYVDREFSRD